MQTYKFPERWKPVVGYENEYIVSTYGRMITLPHPRVNGRNREFDSYYKIKLLTPCNSCGYYRVGLYRDGVYKRYFVHRLMAKAFIPNPENKPQINHKDGDKLNNDLMNLEWATASENIQHSYDNGLQAPPMLGKKHSEESKNKIRETKRGKTPSIEARLNMSKSQIKRRIREATDVQI